MTGAGWSILVVDADHDMRLYVRRCVQGLTPAPLVVAEAATGGAALTLLRRGAIDCVIATVTTTHPDGRPLAEAIRHDATLTHVAVLLLDPDGVLEVKPEENVLTGPFNRERLLDAVRSLVPPRAR